MKAAGTGGWADRFVLTAVDAWCYARFPVLVRRFRRRLGYWPSVAVPVTFHEKVLWRKLVDHDPRFTELSDKLLVKRYVLRRHPGVAVAPVLWSGTDPAAIPDVVLRGDVYVKATHGSGMNVRVRNGQPGRAELERLAGGWMRRRFGRKHHEWGYFGVEPGLLVEPTIEGGEGDAYDLKAYVAGGRVTLTFAAVDRHGPDRHCGALDRNGRSHTIRTAYYGVSRPFEAPEFYRELVRCAEEIGREFDQVRVDFIASADRFSFAELTFYSEAGYDFVRGRDHHLFQAHQAGWDLRESWFLSKPQPGLAGLYARALKRRLNAG